MDRLADLDTAIETYHEADARLIRGDADFYKGVYSHRDDVTLANPFGGIWRGWEQVEPGLERAASLYTDGEFIANENVARQAVDDLAYMVEIQRFRARLGRGTKVSEHVLRTTSVLRREDGAWRVVHRHADTRTQPQAPDASALA